MTGEGPCTHNCGKELKYQNALSFHTRQIHNITLKIPWKLLLVNKSEGTQNIKELWCKRQW